MPIMNMFQKDLELIAKTVKVLNESDLDGEYTYVHVEIRVRDTHQKVGDFCDEIAPDSWYYQPVNMTNE